MKIVILAGGLGTRISEETTLRPKPMVEIGAMPILWHIMKIYSHFGFKEFVICLGYKGYMIKEFFVNYHRHSSDLTIDLKNNNIKFHNSNSEDWKVTLVDTGETAMTGSRIKKIKNYIDGDFCLTYGDGLSNVNIKDLVKFHKEHNKIATLTAIKSVSRFGVLEINNNENGKIISFKEKPEEAKDWINGGFFVLSKKIFDYIGDGDDIILEQEVLNKLAEDGQLMSFKHRSFWHCMDNLRDKINLEEMWKNNEAAWKIW